MLFVARRISPMLQIQHARGVALRALAGQEAVLLLGVNVADVAFLRLEVERHLLALILVVAHLEHRHAVNIAQRVGDAHGMHHIAVHVDIHLLALQVHVLILHVGLAVKMSRARGGVIHYRVVRRILHRGVDAVGLFPVDAVQTYRVVDNLVVHHDCLP